MPDREIEREIHEIKREIIESRGLVIKTNNLTSTLGSDLKSIAKRQTDYERRLVFNSVVAYVLTITVIFVGAYFAYFQRNQRFEVEKEACQQEKRGLQVKLDEKQRAKIAREKALQRAAKLAELVSLGEREKVIEEVSKINREELSDLEVRYLDETVTRFRNELSMKAFQEGIEHSRNKRFDDAIGSYERSVELAKGGPHLPRVKLYLAEALRFSGKHTESITVLRDVLNSDLLDRELVAESRWNLALCYVETHKRDQARRELIYLINKFPPSSQWFRLARHKLIDVNKMR